MAKRTDTLNIRALSQLTEYAAQRQATVEFAGFIVREDQDSIAVADPMGTWVIPREHVAEILDWSPPEGVHPIGDGTPKRITIREGATIQEIRPWRVHRQTPPPPGNQLRSGLDEVFTLDSEAILTSEGAERGWRRLADLERRFARQLGWDPSYPHGYGSTRIRPDMPSVITGTYVYLDGYCDTDWRA